MSIGLQSGQLLPQFTMDHLGTSFKVILVDSVREIDPKANDPEIIIPDESGLHKAISWQRAIDPRKLTGGDIRYLRKSLGMKAKDLAVSLDISPEYLSRCEAGTKVLAGNVEKMLRLTILLEIFYVLDKATERNCSQVVRARVKAGMTIMRHIVREMRIMPVSDADSVKTYFFTRKRVDLASDSGTIFFANDDDCGWSEAAA